MRDIWTQAVAEHAFEAVDDNYPRNPWFHDVEPEEFKAYYDAKMERIERLKGTCKREGCDNGAKMLTWQYCSHECESQHLQHCMDRLIDLFERKGVDLP